jgi:hypothetical protein
LEPYYFSIKKNYKNQIKTIKINLKKYFLKKVLIVCLTKLENFGWAGRVGIVMC